MLSANFVFLSPLVSVLIAGRYALDTVRGKTQPNRVTWLLWSVAPLIAFAAELTKGVGLQSLTTFVVGFFPLVILMASFVNRSAYWKTTVFDYICGALACVALLAWLITSSGDVAIAFSIATDALAALPTVVKAYRFPESESASAYFAGALNGLIALSTIDHWTFAGWGFPAYLFVAMGSLGFLIVGGQRSRHTPIPA